MCIGRLRGKVRVVYLVVKDLQRGGGFIRVANIPGFHLGLAVHFAGEGLLRECLFLLRESCFCRSAVRLIRFRLGWRRTYISRFYLAPVRQGAAVAAASPCALPA